MGAISVVDVPKSNPLGLVGRGVSTGSAEIAPDRDWTRHTTPSRWVCFPKHAGSGHSSSRANDTGHVTRRHSSVGWGVGPSRLCASAGAGRVRPPARRRSGRCRPGSGGGTRGTRTPWSLRRAGPAEPRSLRTRRPTARWLPEQCPCQQTDDSKRRGDNEDVVGGLGDELAIRVEAHRTSIVPFPWKPSRCIGHRAS